MSAAAAAEKTPWYPMLWIVKTLRVRPNTCLSQAYAVRNSSGANAVCQSLEWTMSGANDVRWQQASAARVSTRYRTCSSAASE
jgi:hypothetical protein